jgi:hypothetical protein
MSIRETLSSSKFWYLDLIVILLYSFVSGFLVQRSADSGDLYPEKVLRTLTAAFLSYLAAFIIAVFLKKWRPNHIYWFSAALIGSMIFAFLYGVVIFIANSLGNQSLSEILRENSAFFVVRIVFQSILFAVPIVSLLAFLRILHYWFHHRQSS